MKTDKPAWFRSTKWEKTQCEEIAKLHAEEMEKLLEEESLLSGQRQHFNTEGGAPLNRWLETHFSGHFTMFVFFWGG